MVRTDVVAMALSPSFAAAALGVETQRKRRELVQAQVASV